VDAAIGNLFAAKRLSRWDEKVNGRERSVYGLRAHRVEQMPLRLPAPSYEAE
jgi:hypothetical protein